MTSPNETYRLETTVNLKTRKYQMVFDSLSRYPFPPRVTRCRFLSLMPYHSIQQVQPYTYRERLFFSSARANCYWVGLRQSNWTEQLDFDGQALVALREAVAPVLYPSISRA